MNVHISYKAGKTPEVEREFQHQFEKLERRLHVFNPDLVHFHAIVDQENGQGASTSLNLRLPSGQMAVQKSGENILAAVKGAFTDLLSQLTKHKELLRGQWNWKSRRGSGRRSPPKSRGCTAVGGCSPTSAGRRTARSASARPPTFGSSQSVARATTRR